MLREEQKRSYPEIANKQQLEVQCPCSFDGIITTNKPVVRQPPPKGQAALKG